MKTERAEAKKKAAALACAKSLSKAIDAMNRFSAACRDCGHGPASADDSRLLLVERMAEYSSYLGSVFDR